ncbi:MAG: LysM peptidoglycan-binding domain-containing protein [Cytophagales bacterium]
MRFILFFILLSFTTAEAQTNIDVPDHIYFAGMKLNLSKSLRNNLAAQIQSIQKNKTYFQAKVSLADMYFPIIERVFTEEDIPLDFKYLAIQESSLQSDVVSTSNAVGYWQFKKESAVEVGLVVNGEIDERKHIVESSRGAARYLKKNYLVMTNWIYALIAYNTGLGGARNFTNKKYIGANEMDLDNDLHWYAIKFLAHKLAYEDKVGYAKPNVFLLEYAKETAGKPLSKIAKETEIGEDKILNYNKWALRDKVSDEKSSIIILPVAYGDKDLVASKLGIDLNDKGVKVKDPATTAFVITAKEGDLKKPAYEIFLFTTNNGLDGVVARETDNVAKLAFAGRISIEKFRQYNEMERFEELTKGQIYYFESKRNKAIIPFHTVKAGESLWDIAQVYGIKINQLKKKNRIENAEALQEGRLLYLRFARPSREPIIIAEKPVVAMAKPVEIVAKPVVKPIKKDTFNTAKPQNEPSITVSSVNINTLPAIAEPIIPPTETILPVSNFAGVDGEIKTDENANVLITKLYFSLPDSTYSYHLVNQSQTLYSLSRYYRIKIDSLKNWNNIGQEGIKFGQKIIVAKNTGSLKSNFELISVNEGQSLDAIAKALHTTTEKLMLWNDKKDQTVFIGEVLKIR